MIQTILLIYQGHLYRVINNSCLRKCSQQSIVSFFPCLEESRSHAYVFCETVLRCVCVCGPSTLCLITDYQVDVCPIVWPFRNVCFTSLQVKKKKKLWVWLCISVAPVNSKKKLAENFKLSSSSSGESTLFISHSSMLPSMICSERRQKFASRRGTIQRRVYRTGWTEMWGATGLDPLLTNTTVDLINLHSRFDYNPLSSEGGVWGEINKRKTNRYKQTNWIRPYDITTPSLPGQLWYHLVVRG